METLPIDVFDNVFIKYLCPMDLYNLAQTCKYCQKLITFKNIQVSTHYEVTERLREIFDEDWEPVREIMIKSKAVISGSFLLQCILGERWDGSDIDIYIDMSQHECYKKVHDKVSRDGQDFAAKIYMHVPFYSSDEEFDDVIHQKFKEDEPGDKLYTKYITIDEKAANNILVYMASKYDKLSRFDRYVHECVIVDFDVNYQKVQFICVKDARKTILSDYDFNICKNMYEFSAQPNVYIHEPNEIFSKYTNFSAKSQGLRTNMIRYCKYSNRGFRFYKDDTDQEKEIATKEYVLDRLRVKLHRIIPCNERYKTIIKNSERKYVIYPGFVSSPISRSKDKTIKIFETNYCQCGTLQCDGLCGMCGTYGISQCTGNCAFQNMYPNIFHLHTPAVTESRAHRDETDNACVDDQIDSLFDGREYDEEQKSSSRENKSQSKQLPSENESEIDDNGSYSDSESEYELLPRNSEPNISSENNERHKHVIPLCTYNLLVLDEENEIFLIQ